MEIGLHHGQLAKYSRFEYVVYFLNSHPIFSNYIRLSLNEDLEHNIYYGQTTVDGISIPCQQILFGEQNIDPSKLTPNVYFLDKLEIYSVEAYSKQEQTMIDYEKKSINFDVFEMIFFHISRIEELYPDTNKLNGRGLLAEEAYFVKKHKIEKAPLVDNLVVALIKILCNKEVHHKTKIVMSHDIDHIQKYSSYLSFLRKLSGHVLRVELKSIPRLFSDLISFISKGKDPYDVYEWMLAEKDIEKYIFYLVGGSHQYDTPTPLNHDILLESLRLAKSRGYEICIHPSFESTQKEKLLKDEKAALEKVVGQKITTSRQHYLQYRPLKSMTQLIDAGVKLDSSLGFNSTIGFRCGTGFKYKLYDFENETGSELLEQPLSFMDSAMMKEANFDDKKCRDLVIDILKLENTCICANFHNSRFDDGLRSGINLKSIYQLFLNY